MSEEILATIREMFGYDETMVAYDPELLMHINSSLSTLTRIGVGPQHGFIATKTSKWEDFFGDQTDLEGCKQFIFVDTKIIFDPPANSFVVEALKGRREELLFTIGLRVEGGVTE